jgi:hypothetical protein
VGEAGPGVPRSPVTQRYLSIHEEAALAQLVAGDIDAAVRNGMRKLYIELARYPSDRLFKLIWMVSQPIAKYHDVGFPSGVLAIASHILQNGLNIELQDEVDFESKWYQAAAQRGVVEATDWNVEGSRVGIDWNVEGVDGKGVLHAEKERPWSKPWDVFISHASEDKAQLVRPLADALKEYGVKVWYDSFSMQPGSNLGHSIDAGIAAAEFGIIVLSPRFIAKEWPRYEFDAVCQRRTEQGGRLIILWHTLAQEDRPEWTKALDLEKCLDTATQPLTALTVRVLEWVRPDLAQFTQRRLAHAAMLEREAQGQAKKSRVDGSELHLPPRRYERLPATLVDRVQLLRAVLFEVKPHSMGFWLEGFLHDYTPERQIAFWERFAAMYQEAVCVVDWLQERGRKGVLQIFKRQTPSVKHSDVHLMLNLLLNSPTPQDDLSKFHQTYPEEIVNIILDIATEPSVIDFDDDS